MFSRSVIVQMRWLQIQRTQWQVEIREGLGLWCVFGDEYEMEIVGTFEFEKVGLDGRQKH